MTYYFCAVKAGNWDIILKKNIYFLNFHWETKMNDLQLGDKLIFYLIKDGSLTATYEVISKPKHEPEEIVVKIKPVTILSSFYDFKQLIGKLEMIKKSKCWGTYVQVPLRKLSKNDEDTLLRIFN